MAICKDCICYESCKDWAEQYEDKEFPYRECSFFKPKSRYIELPCAVGDYVEWDSGLIKTLYCVMGFICDSAGFRFILSDFSPVVNHRNITRVLTKEEAEKALNERK